MTTDRVRTEHSPQLAPQSAANDDLTAAYLAGWRSNWINVSGFSWVGLQLELTFVDATSLEIRFETDEGAPDPTADQPDPRFLRTDETGAIGERSFTVAGFPNDVGATKKLIETPVDTRGVSQLRVHAKKTGGVGIPSLQVYSLAEKD